MLQAVLGSCTLHLAFDQDQRVYTAAEISGSYKVGYFWPRRLHIKQICVICSLELLGFVRYVDFGHQLHLCNR